MAWRWYEMTDKNEVITIPDKGLEEAIKYELNLNPNCEITKDNIKSLRWLDASNKGILDLTGLDNAINLEELYLGYNQIEDISTLSELTNLKILNLSNLVHVKIPCLHGFRQLKTWKSMPVACFKLSLKRLSFVKMQAWKITKMKVAILRNINKHISYK